MKNCRKFPARALGVIAPIVLLAVGTMGYANERANEEQQTAESRNEASKSDISLSWDDLVKLVDAHPRIAASRHEIVASRAAVDAAGAITNPSVEATAAYGQAIDKSASKFEWGIALTIPFDWIGQRGAKMDGARSDVRVADAESQALRRDVLLQLRVLFWTLVYEQERAKSLKELNGQMSELARTVKRRVDNGEVRPVEAIRVDVEAEKLTGEMDVASAALAASQERLGLWLGARSSSHLVAEADFSQLPDPKTVQRTRQRAGREHPAVVAANARIQSLEADVMVERRARVPSFSIEPFTDHELDRRAYGVGLAVDLPVWNWNKGNIKRSEQLMAAQKKRAEAEQLDIEALVIEAQSSCRAGISLATRYKDRILPGAESSARIIERTYQLGDATLLELIDARRTLLETKREFLETLAQTQIDCSRLSAIAGEEE